MEGLHQIKRSLIDELLSYSGKSLTSTSVDEIDKLAHAAKNVEKLIESEDDGYSGYYPPRSYRDYRGRSYAKRDSMGRYSRDGSLADELRDLMRDASSEEVKSKIRKLADQIESM